VLLAHPGGTVDELADDVGVPGVPVGFGARTPTPQILQSEMA
jgi:hypothetical protein